MKQPQVTYRGCVNAWECDQWGHQNVQFYLSKASDAQAALCAALGLPPSYFRQTRRAVLPVADRILFQRELLAGDILAIRSGVRSLDPAGTLRFFSAMRNEDTGGSAAFFETQARLTDLASGAPIPWPEPVMERAAALAGPFSDIPPPPDITGPRAPGRIAEGLVLTYRGSVESWECDETETVPPRFHIARFADCANQLFRHLGIAKETLREQNTGTAALDYDILYRVPVRVGKTVEIKSGLLEVREKVFRFFHHLLDSVSGEILTSIEVAAVFFDLTARKSVPAPEAVRANAQRLLAASGVI